MGGSGVAREAGGPWAVLPFKAWSIVIGYLQGGKVDAVRPALRALGPSISSLSVLEGGR